MKRLCLSVALATVVAAGWANTVVFQSGMTSSAGFFTTYTQDVRYMYGYNWGADTINGTTGYATIPASPSGDTTGLKVTVNNNDFDTTLSGSGDAVSFKDGFTAYATTEPQTANYDFEVDAWINYTFPILGGGTGSTEHIGIVIQSAGNKINVINVSDLSSINPVFGYTDISTDASSYKGDGVSFGYNGDSGEAASNIWCYDPVDGATSTVVAFSHQVGNYQSTNPSAGSYHSFDPNDVGYGPFDYALSWPAGRATADRIGPGFLWNHLKASVRGANVTFYVNNYAIVTYTSVKAVKRVGILMNDPFSSVSSPASESFGLFDNFKITDIDVVTEASNWSLYE